MLNKSCDGYGYGDGGAESEYRGALNKRQFSLGYLFAEISLIAVALGVMRLIVVLWGQDWAHATVMAPLVFAEPVLVSAAIGGLFGRMSTGAFLGIGLLMLLSLVLPSVQ